jgi:hypothetical protein
MDYLSMRSGVKFLANYKEKITYYVPLTIT